MATFVATATSIATGTATGMTSDAMADQQELMAKALKSAENLRIEAWTFLGVAWITIILRTIGRIISVPISRFDPDDYIMLVAGLVYAMETIQIHFIAGLGGSNNMPPAVRATRTPEQIKDNILASKLFISGWIEYGMTVWLSKACMCFFFRRLFQGLADAQRKIRIALWLVLCTYILVFVTTMAECVPFHKNWQVIPDPGSHCTQGLAKHVVILILNVGTDMYLIHIPLPIFIKSTMPLHRKIIITLLFGAGIFVTIAAILRSAFVFQDLYSSILMAQWTVRESCVGFIVNNAPMITPLFVQLRSMCCGDRKKDSPFSTKDIGRSIYSRSSGSAAKRQKRKNFMVTLGEEVEISLEHNPPHHRDHNSESAGSLNPGRASGNPGIRVDVEVQLQYDEADLERQMSSKRRRDLERLSTGHLAGKDKGNYKATCNGRKPR